MKWRTAMHEIMKPATVMRHQLPIMSDMFQGRMKELVAKSQRGEEVQLYHAVRCAGVCALG